MRPTQWVKNLFVLAALLFGQRLGDPPSVTLALLALAGWCLTASGVYLGNDLLDLERDRAHPEKRLRPLAAGQVPVWAAATLGVVLLTLGIGGGFWVHPVLGQMLALYTVINVAYSLWLKHVVLVDVMLVASGFVLRVLCGAFVIDVPPSPWIVICSALLALFLGFAKRRQELARLEPDGGSREVLTQYTVPFLDRIQVVICAATIMAYLIYCVSPETVAYLGDDRMLVSAPLVLHGLLRYLYLVQVKGVGENPTRVALTDPGILATTVLWVLTCVALLYG